MAVVGNRTAAPPRSALSRGAGASGRAAIGAEVGAAVAVAAARSGGRWQDLRCQNFQAAIDIRSAAVTAAGHTANSANHNRR
jgi:hypothetical protein